MTLDVRAPDAGDPLDVDELAGAERERTREARAAGTGDRNPLERRRARPHDWTESTGANTCVFDTAATVIASGAVPGEPTVPMPNSSRSLPAEITGTTPAAATLWTTSIIASFAGSVSAPPPEKLITSIPSRTADSNAAAISGVLAMCPIGVGTLKTR